MRVRWNDKSKKQLRKTASYIGKKFGEQARMDFLSEVRHTNALLGDNPNMGPSETFLSDLPSNFLSVVVCHHNRIVYHIVDDHIEVVAFWDTRREPKNQAQQTTESFSKD